MFLDHIQIMSLDPSRPSSKCIAALGARFPYFFFMHSDAIRATLVWTSMGPPCYTAHAPLNCDDMISQALRGKHKKHSLEVLNCSDYRTPEDAMDASQRTHVEVNEIP